jgi:putative drug exporter of the RND superfamily
MGILFGLAMDYEVFLVSRIREEYVHGDDAHRAIEDGFAASSRVVIAAAVIMFAVFAAFVPDGEGPIKTIAFGLAVGVFIDAFVVRMTLVPAVLALLGRSAWWLPHWVDRGLPSFDVEGAALTHQLALADWPAPGDRHAVYAEDLAVGSSRVSLAVRPGQVAVIDGPDASALLLTLSGRMAIAGGRVKVAGLVLPEQAGAVRSRTAYLDCATSPDVQRELTGILRAQPEILFVDHADLVPLATFDNLEPTVVLAVRDRALVDELRPEMLTASPA